MMQPIRMRTAIEMRLFTSGKASSSSPVLVLKVPTKRQRRQREKLPLKALHSAICRQKYFPREYFSAADRGDVYIIEGHKNLTAFISLRLIQKQCIQKIIFLKKVCLGIGFPSQVLSSRKGGKCECRVTHQ